jgi:restriction system protein
LADQHEISILTEPDLLKLLTDADASYDPEIRAIIDDATKWCPKCGARMEIKTAKKGEHAGSAFWGCSAFPACWYKMPL